MTFALPNNRAAALNCSCLMLCNFLKIVTTLFCIRMFSFGLFIFLYICICLSFDFCPCVCLCQAYECVLPWIQLESGFIWYVCVSLSMLFGFAITWASLFNQMHCVGDSLARCFSIGIFESPSLGHCNDFGSYFFFHFCGLSLCRHVQRDREVLRGARKRNLEKSNLVQLKWELLYGCHHISGLEWCHY